MPITAPGVNLKNLLPPPAIDPTDRPQEQMTLADMLVHKFKDFVRPVTGKVEHWLNDPEQQANANLLLGGPMGMAHVWHGSPHKFTKFDMSKIGTGEGAQAYGHGLYFADNPEVANMYQKTLAYKSDTGNAIKPILGKRVSDDAGRVLIKKASHYPDDPARAAKSAQWESRELRDIPIDDLIKATEEAQIASKGNMYKVDLPDDSIAKMLDWDKPLSQQPESVRRILSDKLPEYKIDRFGYLKSAGRIVEKSSGDELTGRDIYNLIKMQSGEDDIRKSLTHGTHKLVESGIPGIKYLDQGSRAGGKGTYNYVVFDDTIPEILEINGKAFKGLKKKGVK